jgi:hypothetical protein
MPKLPRNMVKIGRFYHYRRMIGGRVVKRTLGSDYQLALARLRSLKSEGPVERITLEEVAGDGSRPT